MTIEGTQGTTQGTQGTKATAPPKAKAHGVTNLAPCLRATVKADDREALPAGFMRDLQAACAAHGAINATALARVMNAHGLYMPTDPGLIKETRKGKALRDWTRARASWVGKGGTYGFTFAIARDIAAGYAGKVAPTDTATANRMDATGRKARASTIVQDA